VSIGCLIRAFQVESRPRAGAPVGVAAADLGRRDTRVVRGGSLLMASALAWGEPLGEGLYRGVYLFAGQDRERRRYGCELLGVPGGFVGAAAQGAAVFATLVEPAEGAWDARGNFAQRRVDANLDREGPAVGEVVFDLAYRIQVVRWCACPIGRFDNCDAVQAQYAACVGIG